MLVSIIVLFLIAALLFGFVKNIVGQVGAAICVLLIILMLIGVIAPIAF